jgi:hypothetical protein
LIFRSLYALAAIARPDSFAFSSSLVLYFVPQKLQRVK